MMEQRIKEAFDGIHAETALKEKTRLAVNEARSQGVKERRKGGMRLRAAVCTAALTLAVAVSGAYVYCTPVYALSIDVNPSLELGVNRLDRVVSVTGYNADGERLAKECRLKNMRYTDAITAVLDTQSEKAVSAEDVIITVSGGNGADAVLEKARHCVNGRASCHMQSAELAEEARSCGMSMGRYAVYEQLREYMPELSEESANAMTVRELNDLLASCHGEAAIHHGNNGNGMGTGGNNGGYGHGAHHGQGHGRQHE